MNTLRNPFCSRSFKSHSFHEATCIIIIICRQTTICSQGFPMCFHFFLEASNKSSPSYLLASKMIDEQIRCANNQYKLPERIHLA